MRHEPHMDFEEMMRQVDNHHHNQAFIETLQTRFLPALAERLARSGHIVDIHVEQLGASINIILARGNQWVAEFAVIVDKTGPYWVPVYRQ